ncbi:gluconokinase [Parasphingorhabdus pacifica]
MTPTCLVVMGVSGVGKSTAALSLGDSLGWITAEADEFHPESNIEKMTEGIPLVDADRLPWLSAMRDWITERAEAGENTVVTCSALKRTYREILRESRARVRFVHLRGTPEIIEQRLSERSGHFMPPSLLESQFGDLEPLRADEDGVSVDVDRSPEQVTHRALVSLGLVATPTAR